MSRSRHRRPVRSSADLAEGDWQAQVLGVAGFYQWLAYHTHDSRRSAPGFPDLVLLRPPELLFVELKPDQGARKALAVDVADRAPWLQSADIRPEQATWLQAFADVGAAVNEWSAYHYAALATVDQARPVVEAHVWRPRDFPEVEQRLARGRNVVPMIDRAGA